MSEQEIIEVTKTSPALKKQSKKKGSFAYPIKWKGKVPLKVKMKETVVSDLPFLLPAPEGTLCVGGNEYYVWVNSYGAISAILNNGERLGLKPNEFEVTQFHEVSLLLFQNAIYSKQFANCFTIISIFW